MLKKIYNFCRYKKRNLSFYRKDLQNYIQYGSNHPRYAERIYVKPAEVQFRYSTAIFDRSNSGEVHDGDWEKNYRDFDSSRKYQACIKRFVHNYEWEDTGIYEYLLDLIEKKGPVDGCSNLDDIVARYKKLDQLYHKLKNSGKSFLPRKKMNRWNFREEGGVLFHIDKNNNPIFGNDGLHRISIAKILELEKIPAQIGVVHVDALSVWRDKYK